MRCTSCGFEFGDLQARKIDEYYDAFDENVLVRIFKCPKCGSEVEDSFLEG